MDVFMVSGDTDYGVVHAGDRTDVLDRMQAASGRRSEAGWVAPELEPHSFRKKDWMVWTDCVLSVVPDGDGILLGKRACAELGPLLLESGELLPVLLDGRDYHWFNCLAVLDGAVDDARTRGTRYRAGGHEAWDRVSDWAFDPAGLVGAPPIFRVPQDPCRQHFCTAATARAIRTSGLIGFDVRKVWTSTPDADGEQPLSFPDTFRVPRGSAAATRRKRGAARRILARRP